MNEKIRMKLLNFIRFSSLNARCFFGCANEMELSREVDSGSLNEFKVEVQNKLLNEFNHINMLYLLILDGNDRAVGEYLAKYRNQVNENILGIAVIENCALISDAKMGILLNTFNDSCSVNLAFALQNLRKSPKNASILNRLNTFNEAQLKKTEIFKLYTEETNKILQMLKNVE